MIKTFEIENISMDPKDPWSGMLAATACAVHSTCHTALQATPGQLAHGRDMTFNIKHVANWQAIKERKQKLINANNEHENKKHIQHTHKVNDKVLLTRHDANKYEKPCDGPFCVVKVNTNGTLQIKRGKVLETINIRHLKPFRE